MKAKHSCPGSDSHQTPLPGGPKSSDRRKLPDIRDERGPLEECNLNGFDRTGSTKLQLFGDANNHARAKQQPCEHFLMKCSQYKEKDTQ
jgi:hypothetical protein